MIALCSKCVTRSYRIEYFYKFITSITQLLCVLHMPLIFSVVINSILCKWKSHWSPPFFIGIWLNFGHWSTIFDISANNLKRHVPFTRCAHSPMRLFLENVVFLIDFPLFRTWSVMGKFNTYRYLVVRFPICHLIPDYVCFSKWKRFRWIIRRVDFMGLNGSGKLSSIVFGLLLNCVWNDFET